MKSIESWAAENEVVVTYFFNKETSDGITRTVCEATMSPRDEENLPHKAGSSFGGQGYTAWDCTLSGALEECRRGYCEEYGLPHPMLGDVDKSLLTQTPLTTFAVASELAISEFVKTADSGDVKEAQSWVADTLHRAASIIKMKELSTVSPRSWVVMWGHSEKLYQAALSSGSCPKEAAFWKACSDWFSECTDGKMPSQEIKTRREDTFRRLSTKQMLDALRSPCARIYEFQIV